MIRPMPHDPLTTLPREDIPEPTASRMMDTIASAQQVFERQPVRMPSETRKRQRPFFGRTWMEAILGTGMVSTAAVLAFVMSPAFIVMPNVPEAEPMPPGPVRTDMIPSRQVQPLSLDMLAELEPFTSGDLRLGVRNVEYRYALYHVNEQGLELELVEGRKAPADTASITDAVVTQLDGREVLAIRSGFGPVQRWEAFVADGFGYEISAALSHQIWDAANAAEVEQRLAATANN
jgi:hypothetical protein